MKKPPSGLLAVALIWAALAVPQQAMAGSGRAGGGHHGGGHGAASHGRGHGGHAKSPKSGTAAGVQRDADGKIQRSAKAKADFKKEQPCPSTGKRTVACPGYVIDHRQALKRGGKDAPENMQWQTTAAAKAKDKTE